MLNANQFILLGPQGSGKGTQAKVLAQKLAIPHISTGAMFRGAVAQGTALGKQVEALLQVGQLVPDEITNQIVAERLQASDATRGFVLDGYPRNLAQAEFLFNLFPETRAIYLELSDEVAVQRIAGRLTCAKCGTIYHAQFNPPPTGNICTCGGVLEQRSDDTPEAVRARLNDYHALTEPLLSFYQSRGLLIKINGQPSIDEVTKSVGKELNILSN